jgi:decaprenylphospho-beta-D-ribofuranose 2-oxidase
MRAAEPAARAGADEQERRLYGWGRIASSRARVRSASRPEDVLDALLAGRSAGCGLIARGAGRSYGDAAQNGGGRVLDMTGLREIVSVDGRRQTVTVEAGVTLARLLARLWHLGLTLPVVPGTRHVTVGGAIASDVHGKSHHCDGGFARHVQSLSLCVPTGECLEVSPEGDPELFDTTLGGMGLTGMIVQATLKVEPLACGWVAGDLDRTADIEQTLALLAGEEHRRWSVAWLDLLAGGPRLGRALVSRADPWPAGVALGRTGALRTGRTLKGIPEGHAAGGRSGSTLSEQPIVEVPARFPGGLLRTPVVARFNALRWHAAARRERGRALPLASYLFPLDALGSWNRLYGRAGLIQYQFVVPLDRDRELVRCVELLRRRRLPVYLAVLKRFGPSSGGPLSFPIEGWTLAMDLPGGAPGLGQALDELDEIVAAAGGRVYLTKDVRLRKDLLRMMYPELDRLHAQRARVDPDGVLRSDLARRLGLCEEGR